MTENKILKFLIVEDNYDDQKLLLYYLDYLSFQTSKTIVQTLDQAIDYLLSNINFDLIILDLNLPDRKGIDTINAIKEITDTRILIFTGGDMDVKQLEEKNIKGYLPKYKLDSKNLDYQIQLALNSDELKQSCNILENATNKLEQAINQSINITEDKNKFHL